MNITKKIFQIVLISLLVISTAQAADVFMVKNIDVQGLQRVSRETVLEYLPVKIDQEFDTVDTDHIIRTLYATGFFQNVSLIQQGNTLVVKVVERPIISNIKVSGNKEISKDKLDSVLKELGIVAGGVYNSAILEKIKKGLETEYQNTGRYDVKVTTFVTPETRNRVAVVINISEGYLAKVASIQIIGNYVFSTRKLTRELELTPSRLWTFITRTDQYSKQKLDASLEALRNYYLDRGYLKFSIDSSDASLTPDKKKVNIVIRVTEGPCYTVKDYKVVGNLILPESQLRSLIKIEPGDVFSKKVITESGMAISKALGNLGYAFANINAQPDIDETTKQIFITFYIDPGTRVYVRRINIFGNTKTAEVVIRRELRQFEGSLVSLENIEESKRRLDLLGYLEKVDVQTKPVTGAPDQVDLDYTLTEAPSAQAMAGAGYGTQGFVLNARINQNNFLGTGKTLNINFDNSQISTNYSVSYNNPYYTPEGIQRGFSGYFVRTSPSRLRGIVANYTTDMFGGSVNYSIPVTAYDNLQLGYGYQQTALSLGTAPSTQLISFLKQNGNRFDQLLFTGGWSRNRLDRANFPTRGLNQIFSAQISAPITGRILEYYKGNYGAHYYHPLPKEFILSLLGNVGYGGGYGRTSELPFFENFFAGGIGYSGAVRGFQPNSLGPRDSNDSPLGGNLLTAGSVALIVPNPFVERLRPSIFMDVGNVYSTHNDLSSQGPLRYSLGLAADWRVPIFNAVVGFSIAKAMNTQPGDQVEPFQFNIGTNF